MRLIWMYCLLSEYLFLYERHNPLLLEILSKYIFNTIDDEINISDFL